MKIRNRKIINNKGDIWKGNWRLGKDHPSLPVDHNVPPVAQVGENF